MDFSKYFVKDNNEATHYDFSNNTKLKLRPGNPTHNFWIKYCEVVHNADTTLQLGEFSDRSIPLIVKFSVSYKSLASDDIPFDDSLVSGIAKCIQKVVNRHYMLDDMSSELLTLVLEKPMYMNNGFVHYNLRFQMPRCRISISDYLRTIRPDIIKELDNEVILNRFLIQPSESWDSLIQTYEYNEYIPLYGSATDTRTTGERLIAVYDPTGEETDIDTMSNFLDVREHFDINSMPNNGAGFIKIANEKVDKYGYEWILPLILSIGYRHNYISLLKQDNIYDQSVNIDDIPMENLSYSARLANTALSMISFKRYTEDIYWLNIGSALYNIHDGNKYGLEWWMKWSKKVESRQRIPDEEYNELYQDFSQNNPYTELTLLQYAEEDSPGDYYDWYNTYKDEKIVESSREGTAGSIARAFFALNWTKYVYFNGFWYEFTRTHITRMIKEGPGIAVSGMRNIYNNYLKKVCDIPGSTDRQEQRSIDKLKLEITKIMVKIDDPTFNNKVVQSLKLILAKKHERAILNHNHNCMAVHNHVLESIDNQPMLARTGILADYITMWSDTIYDSSLNEGSPAVKQYREFMKQVFHEPAIIKYVDSLFSKAIRSHNQEKSILNLFGPHDAGKTTFKSLMEYMFGKYSYTWPTTNITGRRTQGDTASPTMAAADDKKIVWTEEPEDTDSINEGMLRQESGGGKRHTRRLHENGDEGVATAMHIVISNNKLRITPKPENKTRFPFIPCTSRFMSPDGDQLNEYEYPKTEDERIKKRIYLKDGMFKRNLRRVARGALWVLVKLHSKLNFSNKLRIPTIIVKETKKYWAETDPYTIFVNRCLVKTPDTSISISDDHIYTIYCNWFGVRAARRDAPNLSRFMEYMVGVIGQPDKDHKYRGWRLKNHIYEEFVEETIAVSGNEKDSVSRSVLYDVYKRWKDRFYPLSPSHNIDLFTVYMESIIGPKNDRRGFSGFKLTHNDLAMSS